MTGAVWPADEDVSYGIEAGHEYGAHVVDEAGALRARGISLNSLLDRHGGPVDYVKMDIEGAEAQVLRRNAEWAEHVGCIRVEVHGSYTAADCVVDLEGLGFRAEVDGRHPACAEGVRAADH